MAFKKGRYWQKNYTSTTYYFSALRKTTIKDKYMTNEVTIFFRETIRSTFDDTEKAKQQQHGLFKGQRYLSYWYKVSCHNKGKSIKYEPWVIKKSTVYMSNRNEISKINREKSWYFFFAFSIFFSAEKRKILHIQSNCLNVLCVMYCCLQAIQ